MSARRNEILRELGLGPLWRLRDAPPACTGDPATAVDDTPPATPSPAMPALPAGAPGEGARADAIAGMDWRQLGEATAACRACGLCERRTQTVFGVGDEAADWLFVGEGPGADEDRLGEPFVGQAGKLLDNMLAAIGLARGANVYIANIVKCRPPGNRTPEPPRRWRMPALPRRQIALIRPKLIVALGKVAATQCCSAAEAPIGSRAGGPRLRGIPLVVTYHPAYLLRNLPDKARAWEDLCFARETMARTLSSAPRPPGLDASGWRPPKLAIPCARRRGKGGSSMWKRVASILVLGVVLLLSGCGYNQIQTPTSR
jgi:uracil-DNA glycosylase family 4